MLLEWILALLLDHSSRGASLGIEVLMFLRSLNLNSGQGTFKSRGQLVSRGQERHYLF